MKISVISGPNLNMLGKRDPVHYGTMTLQDIYDELITTFPDVSFDFYQSNSEGKLVDFIQETETDAIVINAAAYTHTSVAIRDALEIKVVPIVEVHLSNPDLREPFRKVNFIRDIVTAHFQGKKIESYKEAIRFLLSK